MYTHLDRGLYALEAVRSNRVYGRPFDKLEVAESCEVEAKVLQGVGGLVDEEYIQRDVETVDLDVCLGVDGVGEA